MVERGRGKFTSVDIRDGISAKTKKPYKLYKFTGGDGTVFGTFSDTIAAGLLKLDGRFLEVVFSTKKREGSPDDLIIEEYRDVTKEEAPFATE